MPDAGTDSKIERGAQAMTNGGVLQVHRNKAGRNTHAIGGVPGRGVPVSKHGSMNENELA
jgi:hypothetical protein